MEQDHGFTTIERRLMAKAAEQNIPMNGSIELLPLCNMNCDMCFVRLSPEDVKRQGRLHTKEEWLSIAQQMKDSGVLYLLLTGGEPLLYPEFKELYLELQDMGMVLTLNTNGTLINQEWADFFGLHRPRRINITLYGASADTYDSLCHYRDGFDKVRNAVRMLREQNVDVKLGASITKKNVQDLKAMHDVADSLQVPLHTDCYMMPSVRERSLPFAHQVRLNPEEAAAAQVYCLKREFTKEFGEEFWTQYRDRKVFEVEHIIPEEGPFISHCNAGRCSFTVNWQGELHPCVVLNHPAVNVFEEGFRKAWEQVSQSFCSHTMSSDCSKCRLRPVCRTCLACAELETGAYDRLPEYMCRFAEETYRLLKHPEEDTI